MGTGSLTIPARFYRLYLVDKPYGCREKDFHYVTRELTIPLENAALVLVDLWSKHYCDSWTQRATDIVETRIVPVVEATRDSGMPVIHAPSQRLAERYPQSERGFVPGDEERFPSYASPDGEWPPPQFVSREGKYRSFRRDYSPPMESWEREYEDQGIAPQVGPLPEEYVVRSGPHMHRVLKKLGILHLFFAGFATNMCLQHRDYGIRAFSERGYNTILIRDCTTAVEAHDTVESLLGTRVFAQEIEMKYSFSVSSIDFISAYRA
jgi:nicotinamidase-related amidase